MSFEGAAVVTAGKNNYRIYFWYRTKIEAANKMNNVDLSEKGRQQWLLKKLFIKVMSNNTPEIMTKQQKILKKQKKVCRKR